MLMLTVHEGALIPGNCCSAKFIRTTSERGASGVFDDGTHATDPGLT